jgi:adenine-specific DNA-methyltransferase
VTSLDWRDALALFLRRYHNGAVYVDPPYTHFQYSRYYHVLNSLLSYDYPTLHGRGRYPSLSTRFSSRFEFRPRPAEREIADLIKICSTSNLQLVMSYGDRGFIPIDSLKCLIHRHFSKVEMFSHSIRHHSQGTPLAPNLKHVTEYVFVGRN